jgi:hypothetical protein
MTEGKWWIEFEAGSKAGPFETQDEARDWVADLIQRRGERIRYRINGEYVVTVKAAD